MEYDIHISNIDNVDYMHMSLHIGVDGLYCNIWVVMKMELYFVWLSLTLVGTSKGGRSEIIGMIQSSGDPGNLEENKMTNKMGILGWLSYGG